MNVRPHESTGIVRKEPAGEPKAADRWSIALPSGIEGVEEGTQVRLVFWDDRPAGERGEIEEIARRQQLELEIVAKGLTAEGALASDKEAFLLHIQAMTE